MFIFMNTQKTDAIQVVKDELCLYEGQAAVKNMNNETLPSQVGDFKVKDIFLFGQIIAQF